MKLKLKQAVLAVSTLSLMGAANAVEFGYTGDIGPAHWAELDPAYHLCGDGTMQSPIDLYRASESNLPSLQIDYKSTALKIVNNGHTAQVNYAPGSTLTVGTKKYRLLQFHFHTPSEHTKSGNAFPLEGHLVHINDNNQLAVLGVFIRVGDTTNSFLKPIFDNIPATEGEKDVEGVTVNVTGLLPREHDYYTYAGSLTTPPCSEGVSWMVLENSVSVSKEQLEQFRHIFEGNARPVQPLNGRSIKLKDD